MIEFMQNFAKWGWDLITGIRPLIEWLFTPISISGFNIAPIYLIGGGAGAVVLIAGIIRAIL